MASGPRGIVTSYGAEEMFAASNLSSDQPSQWRIEVPDREVAEHDPEGVAFEYPVLS